MYIWKYETPDGFDHMWMSSDGEVLTGLWFEGSRDERKHGMEMFSHIIRSASMR